MQRVMFSPPSISSSLCVLLQYISHKWRISIISSYFPRTPRIQPIAVDFFFFYLKKGHNAHMKALSAVPPESTE